MPPWRRSWTRLEKRPKERWGLEQGPLRVRPGLLSVFVSASPLRSEHTWPEPQPLRPARLPVEKFDESLIPSTFRRWLRDIAKRIQCPIEYLAVTLMVCLGTVIGRRVGMRPKRHDNWLVVCNVWGMVVGRPGVLKTPALQAVMGPLFKLERCARREFDARLSDYQAEHLAWEREKKSFARGTAKEKDSVDRAKRLLSSEPKPPTRTRYVTNDATVEKLGELLAQNPNGLLTFRDELLGLLRSLDKQGYETARAFYLEAWNGTSSFSYDRIGRGTIDIDSVIVSVLGGIQPDPLVAYVAKGLRDGTGDDGFIQRFQLLVWPDIANDWEDYDEVPDGEAEKEAIRVFEWLSKLTADAVGAEPHPTDPDGIPFLRFALDAQELFIEWRTKLEVRVRSGEEHASLESYLAKYRSLIPSLALIVHLAERGKGPVSKEALLSAIAWGRFLESHARRVFDGAVNSALMAAEALAQKIQDRRVESEFALRDVYRNNWRGLTTKADAEGAVEVLLDHDWLVEDRITDTGGAPKTRYRVNPRVHEMVGEGTDRTDKSPGSTPADDSASGGDGSSSETDAA